METKERIFLCLIYFENKEKDKDNKGQKTEKERIEVRGTKKSRPEIRVVQNKLPALLIYDVAWIRIHRWVKAGRNSDTWKPQSLRPAW